MWNKISKLLERKAKKRGVSDTLVASQVCYSALKVSNDLFRPISFKNGLLSVSVPDSSSAATVQLSQTQIIEKLNQKLGREMVKKIRIKISC